MPEPTDPHALPDDASLDAFLARAQWPQPRPEVMARLDALIDAGMREAAPVRRMRFGQLSWLVAAAAAAVVLLGLGLWLGRNLGTSRETQPVAEAPENPGERMALPGPAVARHADLPGRPPTQLELATVALIRKQQAAQRDDPRAEVPSPGIAVAPEPEVTDPVAALAKLPPAMREARLVEMLLDSSLPPEQWGAAAASVRPQTLERLLLDPAQANGPVFLAALVLNPDPSAPGVLVRAMDARPEQVRLAVARAAPGSPAVLGLAGVLSDPSVERRQKAARLLAASDDPAVYAVLAGRLRAPALRREALLVLLSSKSPEARLFVRRAERDPVLRAIAQSLRAQGLVPERQEGRVDSVVL